MKHLDFLSIQISIWLAAVAVTLFSMVPILVTAYLLYNSKKLGNEIYSKSSRVHSFLEEAKVTEPRDVYPAVSINLIFCTQRILFSASIMFFESFLVQFNIINALMISQMIFLLHFRPYESASLHTNQLANQLFTWSLLVLAMGYTELLPLAQSRKEVGWVHIAMLVIFIAVSMISILLQTIKRLILVVKRKWARRHLSIMYKRCCLRKKNVRPVPATEPLSVIS